jgi:acetolactate synthase-1/2/3 large subunit
MTTARSVADQLVRQLTAAGSDTVFGVPGGGPNLELIGAAEQAGMRFVLHHGETAGAIAAATYGMLRGAPAMAIATRGPGAASAVNGAAQATLDRFPLLLVTDCVPEADYERVAHQRLDQTAMLRPVTKWSGRIGSGDATATAADAVRLAAAPPRGAVHLDFDPSAISDAVTAPVSIATTDPLPAVELMRAARRPVAIVGWDGADDPGLPEALEALGCPVLTTYQAAGVLPEGHPQLAGLYTSGAIERALLDQADLVLAIGLDTVEPMPAPWTCTAAVVTIDSHPSASTFLSPAVRLYGRPAAAVAELALAAAHEWPAGAGQAELRRARGVLAGTAAGGFGPLELAATVAAAAPPAATATVDAGAHFLAIMPFWPARGSHRLLISNGLATMGFALPAGIGAALARPGTPVVCMAGDGGLGMTLAELETVARLQLPITVVVFDDAALSLIEIKQQPGQGGSDAVRFGPIDFAGVAAAMGLESAVATSTADVTRLLASGWDRPRLIDARIDPATYSGLITATRG